MYSLLWYLTPEPEIKVVVWLKLVEWQSWVYLFSRVSRMKDIISLEIAVFFSEFFFAGSHVRTRDNSSCLVKVS